MHAEQFLKFLQNMALTQDFLVYLYANLIKRSQLYHKHQFAIPSLHRSPGPLAAPPTAARGRAGTALPDETPPPGA